jgi:lipid A ethanolaminephosphotransferase
LTASLGFWLASVCNASLWREFFSIAPSNRPGIGFVLVWVLMLSALHVLLLSLFAWPRVLKAVAIGLLMLAGVSSYFMWTYHAIVDANMLINVFETDWHEVHDLFNWQLPLKLIVLSLLPSYLVWHWPLQFELLPRQLARNLLTASAALLLFLALLWAIFPAFSSTMRNHTQLRSMMNPLNVVYALLDLSFSKQLPTQRAFVPLKVNGVLHHHAAGDKPPMVILVLGETARAANFSLGAYRRDTNPELKLQQASRGDAWFHFESIQSCGTSTAASLPCMFSHLGRKAYGLRSSDESNALDVLQSAGLAVLWLDNQSGCKGVCDRIPTVNTSEVEDHALCAEGECLDGILPQLLPFELAKLPLAQRQQGVVAVLHMMGSHGPAYYKRSPTDHKKFLPECEHNVLQECNQQELLNAYDNSLRYTDHVLAQTLNWLKTQEKTYRTALIYLSDHGESLGEHHLYLHGLPYAIAPEEQTQVPLITWLSPAMRHASAANSRCRSFKSLTRSHDGLFHSLLPLAGVYHPYLRPEWNWFSPCPSTKTKD